MLLTLNADDYAMDQAVDDAILDLASLGAASSTSAMTLSPRWPEAGRRLRDAPLDAGLHLDLTSPFAGERRRGLALLMAAAYAGRIDRAILRGAIHDQLDRFEAALKAPPAFVDGHQHVHQLPVIREALLDALAERYGEGAGRVRLRSCLSRRWRGRKAAVIASAGARALTRLARARGHGVNSDFLGVYDFSPRADLAALWRRWLSGAAGPAPLAMCHVSLGDVSLGEASSRDAPDGAGDPIRAARRREFAWLSSPAFRELCAQLGVKLARAPR